MVRRGSVHGGGNSATKVVLRTRPTDLFADDAIHIDRATSSVTVVRKREQTFATGQRTGEESTSFRFDNVLHNASQEDVYKECAEDVLQSFIEGYNGTILAYGQTGSGKTYTMFGGQDKFEHRGIVPRLLSTLFEEIRKLPNVQANVRVSYLEVYKETLADLLSPNFPETSTGGDLTISEDKAGVINIRGLMTPTITSELDALEFLFEGQYNCAIAEHQLNKASSRSHTVFTIYCDLYRFDEDRSVTSKLHLVDLAGSERLSKTASQGQIAKEATYINKSLSFLEQVIISLAQQQKSSSSISGGAGGGGGSTSVHVPYRSSKLTHLLKDSIGGNSKTVMIATIWGEEQHIDESIGTCKFAQRMSLIKCDAKVNYRGVTGSGSGHGHGVDSGAADVATLHTRLKMLENEIRLLRTGDTENGAPGRGPGGYEAYGAAERQSLRRSVSEFLNNYRRHDHASNFSTTFPLELTSLQHVREILWQCRALYNEKTATDALPCASCGATTTRHRQQHHALSTTPGAASAQQRQSKPPPPPLPPDVECVGELDDGDDGSSGFSVGVAEVSSASTTFTPAKPKNGFGVSFTLKSAAGGGDGAGGASSTSGATSTDSGDADGDAASKARLSAAFESFTKEQPLGQELSAILAENRTTLKAKKKAAKELALRVNDTKAKIDDARKRMDVIKSSSDSAGLSSPDTDDASSSSGEYNLLLVTMRDLKSEYRSAFEELKMIKSEVGYTSKLVESTAKQLMLDFERWHLGDDKNDGRRGTGGKTALDSSTLMASPPPSGASSPEKRGVAAPADTQAAASPQALPAHTAPAPGGVAAAKAKVKSGVGGGGGGDAGSEAFLNAQRTAATSHASKIRQQQQQRMIQQRRNGGQRGTFG